MYGFADPLEFTSVVALIEYCREHTLAPYSSKLDITLGKAISRSERFRMEQEEEVMRNTVCVCVCVYVCACVCVCVSVSVSVCVCVCVCVLCGGSSVAPLYMYVRYPQEEITVDSVIESLRAIERELKEKNKKYNDLNSKLAKTTDVGLICRLGLHVQCGAAT